MFEMDTLNPIWGTRRGGTPKWATKEAPPDGISSLQLNVDGKLYAGWESVTVTRSLEQMAGSFQVSVSERWPGMETARALTPGQSCQVKIGGDTVITGFIDAVNPGYGATDHIITLAGRDQTGDLVDCSATHRPGQWFEQKIEKIAADLCAPFKIPVKALVDTGSPLASFAIEPGQSVFAAIEQICRPAALLAISDGQGGLILTRPGHSCPFGGAPPAVSPPGSPPNGILSRLERGKNILTASATFTNAERFSNYIVESQQPAFDDISPAGAAHVQGEAKDKDITRHRPLLISAEDVVDRKSATERAAWEASVRSGRSRQVQVSVQGWRQSGEAGPLWEPNHLVRLTDDWLGIDGELLIVAVTLSKDSNGSKSDLTLMPQGAFTPMPEVAG